eukprot:Plantae.Rhodophyta-Hildenbrandia_rubra.ctg54553.p1 GENE.Plantae.Rhodophyta-Hildenbrandia_rubra.ctg54553~~Plantae.Rhodophyta-Hildenbrandia_rubra.ctg54553.p1  ORF type:complete len:143 (+),score=21.91 Plantae.Rhodophyta-Hildenbrandia_rubra.ctg54553:222-650(+)
MFKETFLASTPLMLTFAPLQAAAASDVDGEVQLQTGWHLAYSQDKDGNAVDGTKRKLFTAIRSGKTVRVYWAGRRVEHLVDANFLTIFGDEVFAQIPTIRGQRPSQSGAPASIKLAEDGQEWTTIVSTNGEFPYPVKWFISN